MQEVNEQYCSFEKDGAMSFDLTQFLCISVNRLLGYRNVDWSSAPAMSNTGHEHLHIALIDRAKRARYISCHPSPPHHL